MELTQYAYDWANKNLPGLRREKNYNREGD